MRFSALAFAAALAAPLAAPIALAQSAVRGLEERSIEIEGERLRFTLRFHPADAHLADPAAPLSPSGALETLKLLNRYLSAGKIEDAALLSNAPKRRHEVLRDYREEAGENEFRTVFEQYFTRGNRLVAEIAIGRHSLLIWHLAQTDRYAGLFFVRIEGRTLIDDVPSETRLQLRRLLEAYRTGALR